MLVAQDSGKMVLLTQQVKKETLAHDQVDINKWQKNSPHSGTTNNCLRG